MALEDFVAPEVGIAVAATTLALSPQVRGVIRKGLVYGLAGVLRAGDAVSTTARGAAQSAQEVVVSTSAAATDVTKQARTRASSAKTEGTLE